MLLLGKSRDYTKTCSPFLANLFTRAIVEFKSPIEHTYITKQNKAKITSSDNFLTILPKVAFPTSYSSQHSIDFHHSTYKCLKLYF